MGKVDNMDKRINELVHEDFNELCGHMQLTVNPVGSYFNKEIQVLWASKATKDAKLQPYETRIEASKLNSRFA